MKNVKAYFQYLLFVDRRQPVITLGDRDYHEVDWISLDGCCRQSDDLCFPPFVLCRRTLVNPGRADFPSF